MDDSIVSCLGLKDFLGDFYVFKAILRKFCTNVNIVINIFCTGQTPLLLYIVLQNHLLSQGLVKLCKNVEERLVEKSIYQRKFLELTKIRKELKTSFLRWRSWTSTI